MNVNLKNLSPFHVFTETIGIEGLLTLIKIESERSWSRTRSRIFEILQNMHCAYNLQNVPPRDSEQYDGAWKLLPLFDHLLNYF